MAIGTDPLVERPNARRLLGSVATVGLGRMFEAVPVIGRWLSTTYVARVLTRSIARRILLANMIGLVLLLVGALYLVSSTVHLITAKRESLRVQGEIIAAALAANATVQRGNLVLDPVNLPSAADSLAPFRDDGFAALELSLRPERVAPILRRLIQPTNTRARVYSRDGALVSDSALLLARERPSRTALGDQDRAKPRVRNFWTKLTAWLDPSDLPVYREIGTANGTYYAEVRAALTGVPTAMLLLNERSEQIVSVAIPIQRHKHNVQGVLMLSTRPGEIDDIVAEQRKTILYLSALAMLATIVASFMLEHTTAGPMRRLSAAADGVSRNISARTELPAFEGREDEVGQMATAFAKMTGALYRRAEASESFAADVAHELRNPLTAARSTAESLAYARTPEQRADLVDQIQQELKRLDRLITDISFASRLDAELAMQELEPVDLSAVLKVVVGAFRDIAGHRDIDIELELPRSIGFDTGGSTVLGHEGKLAQVLTNLVDNALSFSKPGQKVTVRAHSVGDLIEIVVEDEGPGIPGDRLEKIFDRFYSDRPETDHKRGKNSGLGLSISREIVRAHHGSIRAENRLDAKGARFAVRLPLAGNAQTGARPN